MNNIDYRLSHIHLKVKSTRNAVKRLKDAGFTIEFGHKGLISPNAFIFFNDHAFIEVYMMKGPANLSPVFMDKKFGKQMGDRFRFWRDAPEGFTDFAFEPCDRKTAAIENMGKVREQLLNEGFNLSENMISSRRNVRDENVGFGFCPLSPAELPFLVTAYSVEQIPEHIEHSNGIDSIYRMEVTCSDRDYPAMERIVGNDKKVKLIRGRETAITKVVFLTKKDDFTPPPLQGLFGMNVGFVNEEDIKGAEENEEA
ncbi:MULTISPECIES: VOC family protein [Butyrivibrio]|uniref:Glyoxalase-like domain-containing protein n=1 Tax=Butyrivibrio hungatei TaxID=185008 RepID=A0A1G5F618_9FIRM|nr:MULTISPECIES: VOC family protein [Butyrivibrio]SCY34699.1 Glyoxalase-like domain-containing protein [Butyrivibrio hungatei]